MTTGTTEAVGVGTGGGVCEGLRTGVKARGRRGEDVGAHWKPFERLLWALAPGRCVGAGRARSGEFGEGETL